MDACNDVEDIEDMTAEIDTRENTDRTPLVSTKPTIVSSKNESEESAAVPGTQVIWLKTYGCSHNVSDSEYMQGVLSSYGYLFTEDKDIADLWLLNSCTVKDPSQAAFMHLVNQSKSAGKPLVVAGCVPQADRNLKGLEGVSIVGVQQVDRVVEVVEETLKGHTVRLLSKKTLPQLDLPKIRKNPLIEIIPLSTGCLGACTYCKTRHSRGKLGSYQLDALVSRAENVIAEGVMEIWLSSEDTGAYGLDIGTDLPELLQSLLKVLPQDIMLRVGMTNPPYILDHLDAIAEVLNHPSVYSFIHIPVQSGSNLVLTAMNREYTVEEFCRVVDFLIEHVPGVTIATDIICGFPGETEEEFDETMKLVEKYKFHIMNISQFYPRPGTPAAKMKRIDTHVVKERSRKITKLFESFNPYKNLEGTCCKVWINTEVSDNGEHTVAHTKNYTKVLIPRDDSLMGCTAVVEIDSASRFHVLGRVLSKSPPVNDAVANTIREMQDSVNLVVTRTAPPKKAEETNSCADQCCGGGNCSSKSPRGISSKPRPIDTSEKTSMFYRYSPALLAVAVAVVMIHVVHRKRS